MAAPFARSIPPSSARWRRGPLSSDPASRETDLDDILIGHGRQAGSGPNPARQVGHRAGIPVSVPAQTINKACASSLQAIVSGAQQIQLGESTFVLAGGIESMSRMPYLLDSEDARWGHGWATSRSWTRCTATDSTVRCPD